MRRRAESISLHDVKEALRRDRSGEIRNFGGWSVFAAAGQPPRFIVDSDQNFRPIPYSSVKTLSVAMRRGVRAVLTAI